ncbi:hypothetical protein Dimus_037784 [Dionaea muscipula]
MLSSPPIGTRSGLIQSPPEPGDQGWQLQQHMRGIPNLWSSRRARVQAGSTTDGVGRVDTGRIEGAANQVGQVASRFAPLSEPDESVAEEEGCCLGDSDLEGHRISTSCVDRLFDIVVDTGPGGRRIQTAKQSGRGRGGRGG